MKTRRGFTLLEAMFTVLIMGGLIAILAGVFSIASSNFKLGTTRLQLQGELRRILAPLRRDLRNSSFHSTATVEGSASVAARPPDAAPTVTVRRDGLSMAGLKEPGRDSSYQADDGKPLWDCYLLYFATLDNPNGKLVRAVLDDSPPRPLAKPLNPFTTANLSMSDPALVANGLRVLSEQVLAFEVELEPPTQMVHAHIKLRGKEGRREGKSTAEILEVKISLRPANTWPRL